jgi:hypothetical protein
MELITRNSPVFDEIKSLRLKYIGDNPAFEENFENIEEQRDVCSYNMVYKNLNKIVGALRISPIGHGITLAEKIVPNIKEYFDDSLYVFDANRLVMDKEVNGGYYLKDFLLQTSDWLLKNTYFKSMTAICNKRFVPIYLRIGGSVLVESIKWESSGNSKEYSFMKLDLYEVFRIINNQLNNRSRSSL